MKLRALGVFILCVLVFGTPAKERRDKKKFMKRVDELLRQEVTTERPTTNDAAVDPDQATEDDLILTHAQKVAFGIESENADEERELLAAKGQVGKTSRRLIDKVGSIVFWPNARVPWIIDPNNQLEDKHLKAVREAVAVIERETCISLPELDSAPSGDHLRIGKQTGCWSWLGRVGGAQELSIGDGCYYMGVVLHELSHALGMYHEHSRSDRDEHIDVFLENVADGKERNFHKMSSINVSPFDESSIMTYGSRYFTKNGLLTLQAKDSYLTHLMGRRDGLTFYDRMLMNRAYCAGLCQNKCHNDGFLDKSCKCHCPPGLAGDNCERFDSSYDCGQMVRLTEGQSFTIQSPKFPNTPILGNCAWVILTTNGSYLELDVKYLELAGSDSLEIRYNLPGQEGLKFKRPPGRTLSTQRRMGTVMTVFLDLNEDTSKGLEAVVVAAITSACSSGPCNNGATCTQGDGATSTCHCATGFSGVFCEIIESITLTSDFQTGIGFLTQLTTDNGDWTIHSGATPSSGTGPHDAMNGAKYIYFETSNPVVPGAEAALSTPVISGLKHATLSFYYHMLGQSMGSLKVLQRFNTGNRIVVWSRNGDQGSQWKFAKVPLSSAGEDYSIHFVARKGYDWSSDIAIDTVVLEVVDKAIPTTKLPTTTTDATASPSNGPLEEFYADFETGWGVFSNTGLFDWRLAEGPTPSHGTGPNRASHGRKYAYAEASGPAANDYAILITHYPLDLTSERCLSFDYHMYGSGMGKMKVKLRVNDADINMDEQVFVRVGNHGDAWRSAEIGLEPRAVSGKLMFVALRGDSFTSDIGIDNVRLSPTKCGRASFFDQDFESDTTGFVLSGTWRRHVGATGSVYTGPQHAHSGSYYVYMEASSPMTYDDIAILSTDAEYNTSVCVRFFYHMYGQNMGSLRIGFGIAGKFDSRWERSGSQGDQWLSDQVVIADPGAPFKIQFHGRKVDGGRNLWSSDIALDDIIINEGQC